MGLDTETGAQETTLDQAGSPFPGLTQASHPTVKMQGEARTLCLMSSDKIGVLPRARPCCLCGKGGHSGHALWTTQELPG